MMYSEMYLSYLVSRVTLNLESHITNNYIFLRFIVNNFLIMQNFSNIRYLYTFNYLLMRNIFLSSENAKKVSEVKIIILKLNKYATLDIIMNLKKEKTFVRCNLNDEFPK